MPSILLIFDPHLHAMYKDLRPFGAERLESTKFVTGFLKRIKADG